jgi:hypothetical protein
MVERVGWVGWWWVGSNVVIPNWGVWGGGWLITFFLGRRRCILERNGVLERKGFEKRKYSPTFKRIHTYAYNAIDTRHIHIHPYTHEDTRVCVIKVG